LNRPSISASIACINSQHCTNKQDVVLTGRNATCLPCSVGRPTVHAPGGRPTRPLAASDDDRRRRPQTTDASDDRNDSQGHRRHQS